MAYQDQYYRGTGFAATPGSFTGTEFPAAGATPTSNFVNSPGYASSPSLPGPTPTIGGGSPSNINIIADSKFNSSPFSNPVPDLRYADPSMLNRLNISDLIYNPSAGGYVTRADQAAGYLGSDPTANRRAQEFYNYIGSLPTQPRGTPALNSFYAQSGTAPAAGPSFNSILSNTYNTASPYIQNLLKQGGFGPGPYQGPYKIG